MLWRLTRPLRARQLPAGFIQPCLSTLAEKVPQGPLWTHEIKHDGYRLIARKDGDAVRLWSRNGRDWTDEFVAIAKAIQRLPVDSAVLDGEAVAHCHEGLPDFWGLHSVEGRATACLFAFDLLFHNGQDVRPKPLDERRLRLATVLADADPTLRQVEYLDGGGEMAFHHACRLGLEGVVSKRRDCPYRSGRSDAWRKVRSPHYRRPGAEPSS